MGIRNKCIILLAAQLGLRSGDISSLKLDDIKWDKNLIEKRQQKRPPAIRAVKGSL